MGENIRREKLKKASERAWKVVEMFFKLFCTFFKAQSNEVKLSRKAKNTELFI